MKKTADMTTYQREWSRANRQGDPDYAEKRRQYRLANYERIREQEKKSREKNREKHREDSRVRMKEYRTTERYKKLKQEQNIKRKYGLASDQWDEMLLSQGSACAICRTTDNGGKRWHTDHCHKSKRVRGILCAHCNLMLGHARDRADVLEAAAQYLRLTTAETQ